jgi:carboxypeptidase family protein
VLGIVCLVLGAVVQRAQITARNTATDESHQTTSSTTGAYAETNLAIGPYEIMVKKKGFELFRLPNIQLTVAQSLTVDPKLTTGSVTEEVTVRGTCPQQLLRRNRRAPSFGVQLVEPWLRLLSRLISHATQRTQGMALGTRCSGLM